MKEMKILLTGLLLLFASCGSSAPPNNNPNGAVSSIEGIRVVKLSGTRHELGYAHGYNLANEILDLANNYVFKIAGEYANHGYSYDYLRTTIDELTVWDSGSIEELQGILDGIEATLGSDAMLVTPPQEKPRKLDLLDLKVANALPDWMGGPQCSGFSVWGDARKGNGTLHARNLDYYAGEDGVLVRDIVLFVIKSTDENRSWVSINWPGMIGCVSCMNEDGMSIAMQDVGDESPSVEKGFLTRSLAIRRVIAQGDSVTKAEALLEQYPIYYASNFQISFPEQGRLDDEMSASFEMGGNLSNPDGGVTVRTPSELEINGAKESHYMIVTNHWLKRNSSLEDPYLQESQGRYSVILNTIESEIAGDGEVSTEDAERILRSVEAGGLTIYSTYFAPEQGLFWLSVAKDLQTPAPEVAPVEFKLNELFHL